ncbi:MAG: hypothetical protein AAF493_10885, partial [Pseudomonadota bacterium]
WPGRGWRLSESGRSAKSTELFLTSFSDQVATFVKSKATESAFVGLFAGWTTARSSGEDLKQALAAHIKARAAGQKSELYYGTVYDKHHENIVKYASTYHFSDIIFIEPEAPPRM